VPGAGNPQALNRYSYCYNNPLKYTDSSGHAYESGYIPGEPCEGTYEPEPPQPPEVPPSPSGGDPATPFIVGLEWLTGQGPRHHEFRGGDPFTELLKTHGHIEDVRKEIADRLRKHNPYPDRADYDLRGLQGVPKYIHDYSNVVTLGHTGNLAVTFLGTYGLNYYVVSIDEDAGTAEVLFYVHNSTTLASGTRPPVIGYTPLWTDNIEPTINNLASSGPTSEVTQSFWWTETIRFK
jgi:hypothetical protein